MSTHTIKKCDICHKREGVELTYDDFANEPLTMNIHDVNGKKLKLSCNISIQYDNNDDDSIIDDVVESYKPSDTFDERLYNEQYMIQNEIAEAQLEHIRTNIPTITKHSGDLCKVCFKMMLKVITDYAKFNKEVTF